MAIQLQLRHGTTAENHLFTGALGEPSYDTERKELRIHDGSTAGGKVVSMATGMVASFAGTTAPEGWLVCDGSAVSRTDYADLFAQIGSTYGDGDGSVTFNLPDLSDCFIQGGTSGTTHSAGLPNVTGSGYDSIAVGDAATFTNTASGALYCGNAKNASRVRYDGSGFEYACAISFDASRSNSIYGNSTTVQPKSVEMLFCIKY